MLEYTTKILINFTEKQKQILFFENDLARRQTAIMMMIGENDLYLLSKSFLRWDRKTIENKYFIINFIFDLFKCWFSLFSS